MNTATARQVAKAYETIREALRGASDSEKAAMAESIRRLLAQAESASKSAGKPTSCRSASTTSAEINAAAKAVLAAGGGFGDRKAFISEVYTQLGLAMSIQAFKALLVKLQHAGDIDMCRADLVEVMDPQKVIASEIAIKSEFDPHSTMCSWHFVVIG